MLLQQKQEFFENTAKKQHCLETFATHCTHALNINPIVISLALEHHKTDFLHR